MHEHVCNEHSHQLICMPNNLICSATKEGIVVHWFRTQAFLAECHRTTLSTFMRTWLYFFPNLCRWPTENINNISRMYKNLNTCLERWYRRGNLS